MIFKTSLKERERNILKKEKRWEKEKVIKQREMKLRKDKENFNTKNRKKFPTSKLLVFFLFINCTLIEIFVGFVTLQSLEISKINMYPPDLTPLVALVGAVIGEVIGYMIYAIKSAKENTKGGIVYMTAEHELNDSSSSSIDPSTAQG